MGRSRKRRSQKKRKGCLFWGCLGVSGIFTFALACFGLLVYLYIGSEPIPVPVYQGTEIQATRVKERIKQFEAALDNNVKAEVSFTGDELNTIINTYPEFKRYKKNIHLFIEEDKIKGQVNFTPDMFYSLTPWINEGMWLNGVGTFKVSIERGKFHVHMERLELEKRPLPEFFMIQIREENLAAQMPIGPKRERRLSKISDIEVKNGKVYIRSRGLPSRATRERYRGASQPDAM